MGWGLSFLLRQTILAFYTVLPSSNPHAQILYTGGTLAVYGFLISRFWPWISQELSAIDAGIALSLILMMLAAAHFLPEPQANKGRTGTLFAVFVFMLVFFLRYVGVVIRSACARGIFGEFGAQSCDRVMISQLWLQ